MLILLKSLVEKSSRFFSSSQSSWTFLLMNTDIIILASSLNSLTDSNLAKGDNQLNLGVTLCNKQLVIDWRQILESRRCDVRKRMKF